MWGLPSDLIRFWEYDSSGIPHFGDCYTKPLTWVFVCCLSPISTIISPISTRRRLLSFYPLSCSNVDRSVWGVRGLGVCLTLPIISERSGTKFQDWLLESTYVRAKVANEH